MCCWFGIINVYVKSVKSVISSNHSSFQSLCEITVSLGCFMKSLNFLGVSCNDWKCFVAGTFQYFTEWIFSYITSHIYSVPAQDTAKHRARFCWPPLNDVGAVTKPRCETHWNLLGCRKLANRSQLLVGWSSQYCKDTWRKYCCLRNFFSIVDICISCVSQICCTRLAENTGCKNYPKNRHLRTIAQHNTYRKPRMDQLQFITET